MYEVLNRPYRSKSWIPRPFKRAIRRALLNKVFGRAVKEIQALDPGVVPPRELLARLRLGWDNQGWDAKLDYLEEIAKNSACTPGPILECGSGLTTILLAMLAGKRGVETWTLEHHPQWLDRVSRSLGKYRLPAINLCYAPLRNYESFSWYDPPVARMPSEFKLVICDGPPDLANGGRYGLVSVFGDHLLSGALILFDDAMEAGQQEVLWRWQTEAGMEVQLRETQEVSFALVRRT